MSFGANRTVAVNLKANVSDYLGKMSAAGKATKDFARDAEKHAGTHRQSWDKVGKGMVVTGAAIGAAVGLAVKAYADFDKQMSNVKAVSGASAAEMDRLRGAALQAGKDTKFSASEAAQATAELAKVGISTADILGGALTGSLNLAAAGGIDLAQAAEISGQAMKIFNLQGKDVGHIADVLASGANKSAADVSDLAQALQQGGLVAAQTGLKLDDTVGVLSAFADNALLGSDAGTSLKTMLQRLNPQSKEAQTLMDKLGLSAYDASGQFVGITTYAGKLKSALSGMTDEQRNATLQTLFGSDAVRGANILYRQGAEGIAGYVKAVNDQGAAARVAAIQMDNLSGDLEQLKGSIETALIQAGSGANDILRLMTQSATGAVNAFSDLPQPVQQAAAGLGAVGGGAGLAVGGLVLLLPRIAATREALKTLEITSARVKGILGGPWGIALAAAAVGLGLFVAKQAEAKQKADDFRATLDQQTGALTDNSRAWAASELQKKGALSLGRNLGASLETVTSAALGNTDALKTLKDAQAAANQAAAEYQAQARAGKDVDYDRLTTLTDQSTAWGTLMRAIGATNDITAPQVTQQKEVAAAVGSTTSAVKGSTAAVTDYTSAAEDAKKATDDYVKGLQDAGLVVLTTRQAQRDLKQAIADVSDSITDNGTTLNINSEAGRKNQDALDNVAKSAIDLAEAVYDQTGSQDAMRKSLVTSRESLIRTAERFGMTKAQATLYADSILKIPASKSTTITANTEAARAKVDGLKTAIDRLTGKTVYIYAIEVIKKAQASGNFGLANSMLTANKYATGANYATTKEKPRKQADGGYIAGPGSATSDSIPAYLSNGEYVVRASAVQAYGRSFFDHVNSMRFASGGMVARSAPAPATSDPYQRYGRTLTDGDVSALARAMGNVQLRPEISAGSFDRAMMGRMR